MAALFFYLKVASQVAPLHPRCQKRTDRAVRKTETSAGEEAARIRKTTTPEASILDKKHTSAKT